MWDDDGTFWDSDGWGYYWEDSPYITPTQNQGGFVDTSDPYLYPNIFSNGGANWPAGSTPPDMNDEDIYTNDSTQTGGFWSDLGNLFVGTAGAVVGSAAGAAQAAGTAWVNKNIRPATTQPTTPTPTAGSAIFTGKNGMLLAAAIGLAAFLYFRRK